MTETDAALSPHVRAFLDLIAWSELGDGLLTEGTENGYKVIVGSTPQRPHLFQSYADHPRIAVDLPGLRIYSTAAGRYQIMKRTWDGLQEKHHFPDFGPKSQDLAAVALIEGRGAKGLVEAGDVQGAVTKCCLEWGSFPGNAYGQRSNKMDRLVSHYNTFLKRYEADA